MNVEVSVARVLRWPWLDRVLRALAVVAIALAVLWGLGIRYNATPSVPVGFYRARAFDSGEVGRGSYVCVRAFADAAPTALRATSWAARREVLLKRVEGLPGDLVIEAGNSIAVNDVLLAHSVRLEHDSAGRPLPRPRLPLRLQEHELWLGSSADSGFDSRYFGPVHADALDCIAEPLWTF